MLDRLDAGQPLYTAGLPWAAPDPDAVVRDQRAQVEQVRAVAPAELPDGWSDAGKVGTRDECLAHIEAVWTDMRPLSLRRAMEDGR